LAAPPKQSSEPVLGLVLLGGGARGAFQVGVIKALAEITHARVVPFKVLSGVSVGALNVLGISSSFANFSQSAQLIEAFWKNLNSEKVFRSSSLSLFRTGFGLALSALLPRFAGYLPHSLLDTTPLRNALDKAVDFKKISRAIRSGHLRAVGVTSTCYSSGRSVTYYDGANDVQPWRRVMRDGVRTTLGLEHGLASAGLPVLFEAVKIGDDYHGDGMLSLALPLAPAIRMGATRLLIVGTGDASNDVSSTNEAPSYPSLGDLGAFALDAVFQSNLDADIERLTRDNETLKNAKPVAKDLLGLKHIDALTIHPSVDLNELALKHVSEMPRLLRWFLRRQESSQNSGQIESYLLFEYGYITELIDQGYADAMAMRQEIEAFVAH
jgi:NTE family protein